MLYVVLQFFILKLGHLATLRADEVVVCLAVVALLILRGCAELVLDDQIGIHQQDDGVVERSPAHAEVFFLLHQCVEGVDIKMPIQAIDGI